MRILIAEDDLTSRAVLTAVLRKYGHEVVVTTDGLEAWAALQQPDAPMLVILDWMMPGLDGLEVCRRLRAVDSEPPRYVLMLTALTEKERIAEALDAGANDYLAKPFAPVELRARIGAAERVVALETRLVAQAAELREALAHVKTLHGILPICAHCKRIRDDHQFWTRVEEYVTKHSEAVFSHGICPECFDKFYPEEPDALAPPAPEDA